MPQEMGESREAWGWDVVHLAEEFANRMSNHREPFYIVYSCKPDKSNPYCFRQAIKAYTNKPPVMLGILVWYVDHSKSEFRFVPELSAPYDVPVDPSLLSKRSSDASDRVMEKGEKLNVLIS
jgi:hypothetical protein